MVFSELVDNFRIINKIYFMPMPIIQSIHDTVLSQLTHCLRKELGSRLKNIILFGSRARGDAREDSDYDVLVLVDQKDPDIEARIDDIAGEIFCDEGVLISLFVVEERRFHSEEYNPFFIRIRKEGISV